MMKKHLALLLLLILCLSVVSCGKKDPGGEESGPTDSSTGSETLPKEDPPRSTGDPISVDLILFMGGSNMAGRGGDSPATTCGEGHAYEFRAISDPTALYPITNDFGKSENKSYHVDDGDRKSGSMVPAFCEAYYEESGVPVVAVSCSEGDTSSAQWLAGEGKIEDALERLEAAKAFLNSSELYKIRHTYMVWCQGEADGDTNVSGETYLTNLGTIMNTMVRRGVEKCMIIQTGGRVDDGARYQEIQTAQEELCRRNDNAVMISDMLTAMTDWIREQNLYSQEVYNQVGANAGKNAARYGKDPENYEMIGAEKPPVPEAPEDNQYNGSGVELPIDRF